MRIVGLLERLYPACLVAPRPPWGVGLAPWSSGTLGRWAPLVGPRRLDGIPACGRRFRGLQWL